MSLSSIEEYKKYLTEYGEKEIPKKDVEKEYYENNVLVNVLTADFDENTTDKEKKETLEKFKKYEKQLKSGKKSFHDIYHDYGKLTNLFTFY